jgi:hypothetical protein
MRSSAKPGLVRSRRVAQVLVSTGHVGAPCGAVFVLFAIGYLQGKQKQGGLRLPLSWLGPQIKNNTAGFKEF